MSAEILKNGEEILKCSSPFFNLLYFKLLELFNADLSLSNDLEVQNFMYHMEVYNDKGGTYWLDITDYIISAQSVELLIKMVEDVMADSTLSTREGALAVLRGFHNELIIYKSELLPKC